MLDWLPRALLVKYAQVRTSVLNGDYAEISLNRIEELAHDLEAVGHRCTRDDAIISFVCLYDYPGSVSEGRG